MVQKLNLKNSGKTLIGVTGSFGSGKSTAAALMIQKGACVLDADRLAHEALVPESPVYEKILALFGTGGQLDRKKIADAVFSDSGQRKQLEQIIHPYVFERMREEIQRAPESVMVLDVPLLYETGLDQECHAVVVVESAEEDIRRRLLSKGFSEIEINRRLKAQMPMTEKTKRTKWIIHNRGSINDMQAQIDRIWSELAASRKAQATNQPSKGN